MPVTRAFTLSHGPCDKWSNSSNRTVWVIDLLPMWQGSATIFSHINVRINVRLILSTFKHVFTIKNRRLKDRYRHTSGVSRWITNFSLIMYESPCLTLWIIFLTIVLLNFVKHILLSVLYGAYKVLTIIYELICQDLWFIF